MSKATSAARSGASAFQTGAASQTPAPDPIAVLLQDLLVEQRATNHYLAILAGDVERRAAAGKAQS